VRLLDGGLVFRIVFQNAAENGFGFVMLVAQAIEASQPEVRIRCRTDPGDRFPCTARSPCRDLRLAYAGAKITELRR